MPHGQVRRGVLLDLALDAPVERPDQSEDLHEPLGEFVGSEGAGSIGHAPIMTLGLS